MRRASSLPQQVGLLGHATGANPMKYRDRGRCTDEATRERHVDGKGAPRRPCHSLGGVIGTPSRFTCQHGTREWHLRNKRIAIIGTYSCVSGAAN